MKTKLFRNIKLPPLGGGLGWGFLVLVMVFSGCNKNDDNNGNKHTFYPSSNQTWTLGDQTWSDAIHCPECNKESFEESNTDPQCRSYTYDDGRIRFYYNWAFVDANKAEMCPTPWRVPTKDDFDALDLWLLGLPEGHSQIPEAWEDESGYTLAWSATAMRAESAWAMEDGMLCTCLFGSVGKSVDLPVRCVMDN
jgi:hypothetical protein